MDFQFLTLDSETYGLGGGLRRLAIYDGKDVYHTFNFKDMIKYIKKYLIYTKQVHVYIHNLEFDLRKIIHEIDKDEILWEECLFINNRFVKFVTKEFILHDSFSILPLSLKQLSKDFDIREGKKDLWEIISSEYPNIFENIGDYFQNCLLDDYYYIEYLEYDVISLYKILEKFCKKLYIHYKDLFTILTTSSLSRHIFKNGFGDVKFESKDMSDFKRMTKFTSWHSEKINRSGYSYREIEDKIRESYFGGRTEVFKSHIGKGYHYDVNSIYPYVMMVNEFPIATPQIFDFEIEIKRMWNMWLKDKHGMGYIECEVYVEKILIPVLPIRKTKLFFPTGYLRGVWTFHELEKAVEKGATILKFKKMFYWDKTYKIFKNFVETLSELKISSKKQGDKSLTFIAKLLMNSGYGYLCMRRDDKECFRIKPTEDDILNDRIICYNDEFGYFRVMADVRSATIQVHVGSYITSLARLHLYEMMEHIHEKGGNIYYCDTDSIVTDVRIDERFVDDTELGKWALENELELGYFISPKVYFEVGQDIVKKMKGVSRDTVKNFDESIYHELYEIQRSNQKGFIYLEYGKEILGSILSLQRQGKDINHVEIRDKKMNFGGKQKRLFDYGNNTSEPIHFSSFEEFNNFNFRDKTVKIDLRRNRHEDE